MDPTELIEITECPVDVSCSDDTTVCMVPSSLGVTLPSSGKFAAGR
jgi:hypothetical protein